MSKLIDLSKLLTTVQAAALLGVSETVLRNWKHRESGPAYIKHFGRVFYTEKALADWQAGCTHTPKRDHRTERTGVES